MSFHDFLTLCKENNYKEEDIEKFEQAMIIARDQLSSKKRLTGDSYYDHNLHVASVLVENHSEPEVVTAGILARCLNSNKHKDIERIFGSSVLSLLEQAEEINDLKERNKQLSAQGLSKVIITTLKDIRVIIIKLANKLENMKSIHVFPPDEQIRIAQEVLDIYAPLAYRLGIEKIRVELEDLAFRVLEPEEYNKINKFLEESRQQREESVKEAIATIKEKCKDKVSINRIKGRPKHIRSINKKIDQKGIKLQELYDLLGIRVIVSEIKDCYSLLGLLHEEFEPIEGRLKDYIANPKPNFYRSIHTCVKLPNGKRAEIQIRTSEMDEFAEEGVAAHWRYKGAKSDSLFDKKIAWLKGVLELQKSEEGKEYLDTIKVDLFGDKIYCYTPKGDVKELPVDSTILDFAYSVHEEIGNTCVGGRINGKFVAIKEKINSGDVVEIITNKKQRPRRSWIKIVTSAKSRQKIRKSLKQSESGLAAFHFRVVRPEKKEEQGVLVESEEFPKAVCTLAKCCKALPGEEIVGVATKRRVISVHRSNCKSALKTQDRWIVVKWKETYNQKIQFFVDAQERSGLLADLLHTIATAGFEVKEAKAKLLGSKEVQCSFLVIPKDLEEIKELIVRVKKVKGVMRIYFS